MIVAFFLLLLAGHMLADFVVQSDALVARKRDPSTRQRALGLHLLQVTVCHALFLEPVLTGVGTVTAFLVAFAHVIIDRVKLAAEQRGATPLRAFLADQGAHLLTLGVASWALVKSTQARFEQVGFEPASLGPVPVHDLLPLAVLVACLAFNARGVGFLVGEFLRRFSPPEPAAGFEQDGRASASAEEEIRAGRMIGILERTLLFLVLIQGAWGAAGFVIAAKSIVRFRELERRHFAEYYLLGTLASFLGAVVLAMFYLAFRRG